MDAVRILHRVNDSSLWITMSNQAVRAIWILLIRKVCRLQF